MKEPSLEHDSESHRIHREVPKGVLAVDLPDPIPLPVHPTAARVVIVSCLRLLRDGLADALNHTGIRVVAAVPDAERARAAVLQQQPTVVLMDIEQRDSLSLVQAIRSLPSPPRIVIFAVLDSEEAIIRYIEAGIDGYVSRDGSLADVVAAVESVGRGETIVSPKLAASLFQRLATQRRQSSVSTGATGAPGGDLTIRERQILTLVEQGLTNKEIARQLGIELATVKNHVHRVLEKMKVSRRGQAAARARSDREPRI